MALTPTPTSTNVKPENSYTSMFLCASHGMLWGDLLFYHLLQFNPAILLFQALVMV
jgi:hypothetical protein